MMTNEVTFILNIICWLMEDIFVRNLDNTLIITINWSGSRNRNSHIIKKRVYQMSSTLLPVRAQYSALGLQ